MRTARVLLVLSLAFSVLNQPANSFLSRSGLTTPPQAASAGFHTILFNSNFVSTNSVDLLNSGSATFQWFLRFAWTHSCDVPTEGCSGWLSFSPQSGSNLSVANGALHSLFGGLGSPQSFNNVISAIQNGASYTGQVFGPGFYIEGRANWQYTPTGPPGTALYLFPIDFFLGTTAKFAELDIMETFDATHTHQVLIYWDCLTGGTCTPNNLVNQVNAPSIPVGEFHTWGVRWQTIAQHGGGQGLIDFWMDGVVTSGILYSITDPIAVIETQRFVLIWSSDTSNPSPANLARYTVWGLPYLLKRDLSGDNDNTPMFLNQAA